MKAPETETKMSNPPEGQTQLGGAPPAPPAPDAGGKDAPPAAAAATKAARKVHIQAVWPCQIKDPVKDAEGIVVSETRVLEPGHRAYVTEAEAREFCDKETKGYPRFTGERPNDEVPKDRYFRAVRVEKAAAAGV